MKLKKKHTTLQQTRNIVDENYNNIEQRYEKLKKILKDIINAYDSGNVEINSPEIEIPDHGFHPWHEEWIYLAKKELEKCD